jgi:choline transport protein
MLIYGSIAMTIFTMAVALSLAEMSGAYPTSGGMLPVTLNVHTKRL